MRVRLMQIVDFWVGVPLCALLSIIGALQRLISTKDPSSTKPSPSRILFIELSEMGSAIIAYSALVKAQKLASGTPPYFLIFRRNRESAELLRLMPKENLLVIDDHSFIAFAFSALRALMKIRSLKFDVVLDLELFSRFTALLTFLSGAPMRIGFHRHTGEGLYRGNFLTHRVNYNPHQHMAYNFLSLICAMEAPADEIPMLKRDVRSELTPLPRLTSTASELSRLLELVQSVNPDVTSSSTLIVFNPDPGDAVPIRGWPEVRFAEVAKYLVQQYPDAFAVVIGLRRSTPYAMRFMDIVGKARCVDLTGRTKDLKELLTIFELSKLLVTNDSGPAHMAALTGLESVVLFGPETPALYSPLGSESISLYAGYACSPCLSAANHRHTWCKDNKCLQAISVEQVLAAAQSSLAKQGLSPQNVVSQRGL